MTEEYDHHEDEGHYEEEEEEEIMEFEYKPEGNYCITNIIYLFI